jgi:poly(A) polymerase
MTWTPKQVFAPFLLDPRVEKMLAVFADAGHADDVRFVGGCVRNILMNLPTSDIDMATRLVPDRVKEIFEAAGFNVHPTGIEHGTVTVVIKGEPFEITTLRRDVETDGRRAVVSFTEDWAEDAQRRDFRCNAIYMDGKGRLFDEAEGGIRDAMDRKLVFVGDAEQRIREDYLRVLRLFRFQATLNAVADEVGLAACQKLAGGIPALSGERIEKEIMKLLGSVDPVPAVKALIDTGVYYHVFAGPAPDLRVLTNTVRVTTDPAVRLAALFGYDQAIAQAALDHWKVANDLRDQVTKATVQLPNMSEADYREVVYRVGFPTFRDRMFLTWANSFATDPKDCHAILARLEACIPVFPVKGQDVLDAGVKPGKTVGTILKGVETWWIGSGYPDRDACLDRINDAAMAAA